MKTIYNKVGKHSVRRLLRQWFSGLIKRQNRNYLEEIFEKLQDIEDSIEIIARQIARQIKSRE